MDGLLKFVFLAALVVWLGGVVFFSFVAAPAIFRVFPAAEAGRAVGAIFPLYYAVGTGAGVVALAAGLGLWLRAPSGSGRWLAVAALLTVMLGANAYAWLAVWPRARALREEMHRPSAAAPAAASAEFRRLHAQAMILNLVVLVAGVGVVGATTLRS